MGANSKPQKNAKGVNTPNKLALTMEHKPEQIANTVYAARMGNGSTESGDGWKYRGRGLVQITGKDNYTQCGLGLNIDLLSSPDLLLKPSYAALSAGWFWNANHCNRYTDSGDFSGLTKRINGGTIGQEDRLRRYKAVLAAIK
jgi:putative chitinase